MLLVASQLSRPGPESQAIRPGRRIAHRTTPRQPVGVVHAYSDGDADTLCGEPVDVLFASARPWNRLWPELCTRCERAATAKGL